MKKNSDIFTTLGSPMLPMAKGKGPYLNTMLLLYSSNTKLKEGAAALWLSLCLRTDSCRVIPLLQAQETPGQNPCKPGREPSHVVQRDPATL